METTEKPFKKMVREEGKKKRNIRRGHFFLDFSCLIWNGRERVREKERSEKERKEGSEEKMWMAAR